MSQVKYLINENVKMKKLLLELVFEFGKKSDATGELYKRGHQSRLIKKAMDEVRMVVE